MRNWGTSELKIATIISIFRYIYLQYIHDHVYKSTNGLVNGYGLIILLLYMLNIPLYVIIPVILGRKIYRGVISEDISNDSNHPYNVSLFFIMIFSVLYIS